MCYKRGVRLMRSLALSLILSLVSAFATTTNAAGQSPAGTLRVLVISGGHPFETNAFFDLFKTNAEITCQFAEHPNIEPSLDPSNKWDAIVLYDYNQKISDHGKTNFLAQLNTGTGLVVVHHAIVAFPGWDEYRAIVGAHYYLAKTNINGVEKPRSAFKHGMHFTIHVADPDHPVTRGVKDYEIHDEVYKWFDVYDDCHPLLTTDEPESNKIIGWSKTYGNARVVYMQSGHDHFAYENPNFQQILRQAIHWTAKKN